MSENDKNLIKFIATTVETLRDQVETMRVQMVTKDDLAEFKEQVATKKDLAEVKDQVARIETRVDRIEAKWPRKTISPRWPRRMTATMASKNDLSRLESTMHGEFEQVHLRLDSIDRSL